MTSRQTETFEEDLRKAFRKDLFNDAHILDNRVLCRNVDEDAINKCRLSQYGQMRYETQRFVTKTGDQDDVEKVRDKEGNYDDVKNLALCENVEQIYFETYGEGFDGGPVVDRPGAPYTCPCGLKMMMPAISLPLECPKCRRLTPLGRLVEDGVLRR